MSNSARDSCSIELEIENGTIERSRKLYPEIEILYRVCSTRTSTVGAVLIPCPARKQAVVIHVCLAYCKLGCVAAGGRRVFLLLPTFSPSFALFVSKGAAFGRVRQRLRGRGCLAPRALYGPGGCSAQPAPGNPPPVQVLWLVRAPLQYLQAAIVLTALQYCS